MAGSLNKAMLIGALGRDPEIRTTQQGMKIAQLSIATSESWRDKASGEKKEKTEWHRIVIFGDQLAGICEKYLHKGDKIYIEGAIETRKWTDKDGTDKYTTEIVLRPFNGKITMLETKRSGEASSGGESSQRRTGDDLDDEIPF